MTNVPKLLRKPGAGVQSGVRHASSGGGGGGAKVNFFISKAFLHLCILLATIFSWT